MYRARALKVTQPKPEDQPKPKDDKKSTNKKEEDLKTRRPGPGDKEAEVAKADEVDDEV